jgi:hypothetical protein
VALTSHSGGVRHGMSFLIQSAALGRDDMSLTSLGDGELSPSKRQALLQQQKKSPAGKEPITHPDARGLSVERREAMREELLKRQQIEENAEEERAEKGMRMHRENLSLLTKYMHRPGLWRVQLNYLLQIVRVTRGAKGGPPMQGEFSVRVFADGSLPVASTLMRLSEPQARYVPTLMDEICKICRAKDLAHAHTVATNGESRLGDLHVEVRLDGLGMGPGGM